MAGGGSSGAFQYIELPDGSYGKFDANADDNAIRGALTKDFPDHFRSVQSPIAPPKLQRPNPGMHKSYMVGPEGDTPHTTTPLDLAEGIVGPPARLTKTGAQAMVKGITGRPYLGQPQSNDQTLRDAGAVGIGMLTGAAEGEGISPASAPEAASESTAQRGLLRSGPRASSGAAPRGNGGNGGGAGSVSGFASDMLDLAKPKWLKAAQILRKHLSNNGSGSGSDAGAQVEPTPAPASAPASAPTPVPHNEWETFQDTRNTFGRNPKFTSTPASAPAPKANPWANLQHDRAATTQAMAESKAGTLPPGFSTVQRAQQIKEGLIKGAGGNGAKPATEVATPKQVTPDTSAGDTVRMVESEHNRLERDGGQFGKPTAVGKLQRANAKPITSTSSRGKLKKIKTNTNTNVNTEE